MLIEGVVAESCHVEVLAELWAKGLPVTIEVAIFAGVAIAEEGLTRVVQEPVERGGGIEAGRERGSGGVGQGRAILQGRRRKGYRRTDDARGQLQGRQRREYALKEQRLEEAGGRPEEVSVGLVRRRETPHQRRTDIRDISKAVVGRAVNLLIKLGVGRRARQRHTEVWSSYHFRAGTKLVNKGEEMRRGGPQELVRVGGLGLEYPGKRVERFIERYEAAGDNEDADLARQIINFVTDEEDAMDIEDLSGYRSQDWEILKREMISCWGGKDMRHKIEFPGVVEQQATKDLLYRGLQADLADLVVRRLDAAGQIQRVGGALVLPSLNLMREAAYKELELRGMRKRPDKKREAVAEDFAAKLRSQESMEGVEYTGKKRAPEVPAGGVEELIRQLAEVRVEMATLEANKVAAGPSRVYSGPMECFYCGGGHPKTVGPALAANTESGKVRSVGREYYLKNGRKVEAAAVARMVGTGKGIEVNMAVKQPLAERMEVDKKPAEFQEESVQQKECRRVAAKAMDTVNGGVTLSMRELITVSPMIAQEAARMIREFGKPAVNKGELGQEEGKLSVFATEGRGASWTALVDSGSMINIMPKTVAWIIPILGIIRCHKTKVVGIMAGVEVTVGGVVRELSFIVADITKAVLGRPFLYAFQAGLEYSALGDELMRITDEDGRQVVIGICDKESGDWPETPNKLEKLAGLVPTARCELAVEEPEGREAKLSSSVYASREGDSRITTLSCATIVSEKEAFCFSFVSGAAKMGGQVMGGKYKPKEVMPLALNPPLKKPALLRREGGYHRIAYQRITEDIVSLEVSVGLVRRRETPHQRRTDIRDISKAVVGRAVGQGLSRRARQRHTEVRSSYHFRAGTKANSTLIRSDGPGEDTDCDQCLRPVTVVGVVGQLPGLFEETFQYRWDRDTNLAKIQIDAKYLAKKLEMWKTRLRIRFILRVQSLRLLPLDSNVGIVLTKEEGDSRIGLVSINCDIDEEGARGFREDDWVMTIKEGKSGREFPESMAVSDLIKNIKNKDLRMMGPKIKTETGEKISYSEAVAFVAKDIELIVHTNIMKKRYPEKQVFYTPRKLPKKKEKNSGAEREITSKLHKAEENKIINYLPEGNKDDVDPQEENSQDLDPVFFDTIQRYFIINFCNNLKSLDRAKKPQGGMETYFETKYDIHSVNIYTWRDLMFRALNCLVIASPIINGLGEKIDQFEILARSVKQFASSFDQFSTSPSLRSFNVVVNELNRLLEFLRGDKALEKLAYENDEDTKIIGRILIKYTSIPKEFDNPKQFPGLWLFVYYVTELLLTDPNLKFREIYGKEITEDALVEKLEFLRNYLSLSQQVDKLLPNLSFTKLKDKKEVWERLANDEGVRFFYAYLNQLRQLEKDIKEQKSHTQKHINNYQNCPIPHKKYTHEKSVSIKIGYWIDTITVSTLMDEILYVGSELAEEAHNTHWPNIDKAIMIKQNLNDL
ncbi:hypothetical protein PPACK8108_LOCUS6386 [Phakopsora pachyrhizi]|uniref:Peptidase A2 domain-containing protein n=1 Tax=Phakopsora pachyrhizi TaxID=170000 RepID=A0AAV0AR76_PHAPC|nr:hypothetical protein PPACK8108_LOCUS6386 [Phakopsora pachyrhizi]